MFRFAPRQSVDRRRPAAPRPTSRPSVAPQPSNAMLQNTLGLSDPAEGLTRLEHLDRLGGLTGLPGSAEGTDPLGGLIDGIDTGRAGFGDGLPDLSLDAGGLGMPGATDSPFADGSSKTPAGAEGATPTGSLVSESSGEWTGATSWTDKQDSNGGQTITGSESYEDDNHSMTITTRHENGVTTQTVTLTDKKTGETTTETSTDAEGSDTDGGATDQEAPEDTAPEETPTGANDPDKAGMPTQGEGFVAPSQDERTAQSQAWAASLMDPGTQETSAPSDPEMLWARLAGGLTGLDPLIQPGESGADAFEVTAGPRGGGSALGGLIQWDQDDLLPDITNPDVSGWGQSPDGKPGGNEGR